MPHYIVIGRDGTDEAALERRGAVRGDHLSLSDEAITRGEQLMGVAMLNNDQQMCGSVMLVDFPNRAALDAWLEKEPYVSGDVWKSVEVVECRIGPSFQEVFSQ